jgi:hypothetical protein
MHHLNELRLQLDQAFLAMERHRHVEAYTLVGKLDSYQFFAHSMIGCLPDVDAKIECDFECFNEGLHKTNPELYSERWKTFQENRAAQRDTLLHWLNRHAAPELVEIPRDQDGQ